MTRVAVYPGSFDPITKGHLDIIGRAARLFDEVIVLVANNRNKKHFFMPGERLDMVTELLKEFEGVVRAEMWEGLTMDYLKKNQIGFIVRGLRPVSDFDFEFQLNHVNKTISPLVETVFLMSSLDVSAISSSVVRELAQYGQSYVGMVPENVYQAMEKKLGRSLCKGALPRRYKSCPACDGGREKIGICQTCHDEGVVEK